MNAGGDEQLPVDARRLSEWLLGELRARANPENVAGMARFGISSAGTLGVSMPDVRALTRRAKGQLRRDPDGLHDLASLLWISGVHEARIMAALIDVPALVTRAQAECWAGDLDSWDTCDQLCMNLLWRTAFAWELPFEWSWSEEVFVKRAGFVVIAQLAIKDKAAENDAFLPLLSLIEREAEDDRNDVKKAVNWALRQVGKRNLALNAAAVHTAQSIREVAESVRPTTPGSRAARWIASDALRELRSEAVERRLRAST